MDPSASVTSFSVRLDDRVFESEIQPKVKAQQIYNDAVKQGHAAVLLEVLTFLTLFSIEQKNFIPILLFFKKQELSSEVLSLKIGNFGPKSKLNITIRYNTELGLEGESLRFVLPSTIAPRYVPTSDSTTPNLTPKYSNQVPYQVSRIKK